jgi:hypothetical protein
MSPDPRLKRPDLSPGHKAVAALTDAWLPNGDRGVVVLFLTPDGGIRTQVCGDRVARALLNETIRRLDAEMFFYGHRVAPRKVQGGRWTCRLDCPDGVNRMFVEKRVSTAPPRPARTGLSPYTRWTILERDGFRCRYCGRGAPDVELAIDHVVSVVDGGGDEESNLVAACVECNGGKGRRSLRQGRGEVAA